jgi:LytS/YehU family sensor histidine kinase
LLKQQKQMEMQLAKAEIHPGFILNALKAVQELVSRNAENAASVILQLAELLDYTLYDGSKEKVDLETELQALDNIIAIERAKNGRRNAVQFQLTGVPAGKQIPPLFLLQPLCQYFSDNPAGNRNRHPVSVKVQIDNDQVRMTMETGKHKTSSAELYAFA